MAGGGAGMVPITIGIASVFAANYSGCFDTEAAPTVPITALGSAGECTEVTGCGQVWIDTGTGWTLYGDGSCRWKSWSATYAGPNPTYPDLDDFNISSVSCLDGTSSSGRTGLPRGSKTKLVPCDGGSCVTTAPSGQPEYQPIPYTDPDTGCELILNFNGFAMLPGDDLRPVFKIEPAPVLPSTRATGGVITTCNFAPEFYMPGPGGGGDGPPVRGPWDPIWDDWEPGGQPAWSDWLGDFLGGVLGDLVSSAILDALELPLPQYQYTMRAACNYKEDGTFEDYTITLPAQSWNERVLSMQEMQIDFLQQHLLWKTPTCGGGGQPVTGDPVTINWISDEASPVSGTRLNKRFVYFDQNNTPLQTTVDHWKDFVWQSGPVIVGCTGTPLGKPQVWAASEAEGKRVLEHAAQIAGVDLSNAEYQIGTPKDSRYGVPATMRVLKRKGVLGITSRRGPDGYPEGLPG